MTDEIKNEEAVEETPAVEEATVEVATEEVKEEVKEEIPAVEDEGADVPVPEKFKAIVTAIEEMPVLELNELVKLFEKKFGVSAAAVAVAGPASAGDDAEEKTDFDVELTSDGGAKIPVMKAVKTLLGLGLKEAKEMVEGAPVVIKAGAGKDEAEKMKAEIEAAGGKVTLK